MSKCLDELKKLKNVFEVLCLYNYKEMLYTIEKELKRLEELDNGAYVSININRYNELCDKEDALEIIKKAFDSSSIYTNKLKDSLECGWITQEEYNLLKEVLL